MKRLTALMLCLMLALCILPAQAMTLDCGLRGGSAGCAAVHERNR